MTLTVSIGYGPGTYVIERHLRDDTPRHLVGLMLQEMGKEVMNGDYPDGTIPAWEEQEVSV